MSDSVSWKNDKHSSSVHVVVVSALWFVEACVMVLAALVLVLAELALFVIVSEMLFVIFSAMVSVDSTLDANDRLIKDVNAGS